MRRIAPALALTSLALVVACTHWLPERFAINAPILGMLFGWTADAPSTDQIDTRFHVPAGFSLSIFARDLGKVRWLLTTETGDLVATRPRDGEVILLTRDDDGDGESDQRRLLLEGLNRPHGIEFWDGWLYVGETDAVGRIRFDPHTRESSGAYERIITGLPSGGNHWSRTLGFGPDGLLYVSIGSSCNVCEDEDERRAAIVRYRPDGTGEELFATGLRNAVGFDWQPGTGALFATDNGRDLLGDDFPPCQLTRLERRSSSGWPIANGNRVADPDFGAGHETRIEASTPPSHPFRAHNAPLGIHFVRHARVPEELRGAALVALHGSWNRTSKDGYKVVSLTWQPDGSVREADFMTGFEREGDVAGRPVHVVEGRDGAFYISDDHAGVVWRVAHGETRGTKLALTRRIVGDPLRDVPLAQRPSFAARGEALFVEHRCADCHDPALAEPGVAVKRLQRLGERYDVEAIEALFTTPPSPMPIYPFGTSERRALAVYLLSEPTPGSP